MGFTAIVLLAISKLIMAWGRVDLLPFVWQPQALGIAIGLAVAISIASGILFWLWEAYRISATFYLTWVLRSLTWSDLLWLGLLPGMSEELLFRGVLLPALGGGIPALVLSSVAFGLLHLSGRDHWPYALWAIVVGAVLGGSVLLTQNLLVSIVAHVVTNWISGAFWKWKLLHQPSAPR